MNSDPTVNIPEIFPSYIETMENGHFGHNWRKIPRISLAACLLNVSSIGADANAGAYVFYRYLSLSRAVGDHCKNFDGEVLHGIN